MPPGNSALWLCHAKNSKIYCIALSAQPQKELSLDLRQRTLSVRAINKLQHRMFIISQTLLHIFSIFWEKSILHTDRRTGKIKTGPWTAAGLHCPFPMQVEQSSPTSPPHTKMIVIVSVRPLLHRSPEKSSLHQSRWTCLIPVAPQCTKLLYVFPRENACPRRQHIRFHTGRLVAWSSSTKLNILSDAQQWWRHDFGNGTFSISLPLLQGCSSGSQKRRGASGLTDNNTHCFPYNILIFLAG